MQLKHNHKWNQLAKLSQREWLMQFSDHPLFYAKNVLFDDAMILLRRTVSIFSIGVVEADVYVVNCRRAGFIFFLAEYQMVTKLRVE
jgi:hypothetical protein